MHEHSGKVRMGSPVPFRFKALAKRHVGHYVGGCTAMDEWAKSAGIPAQRRSVIVCGLDLSFAGAAWSQARAANPRGNSPLGPPREWGDSTGALVGICLGGVRPEKGIDTLLAAVARSTRRGQFRVVVVGGVRDSGYWRHCLRESARLGIQGEVHFAGESAGIHEWLSRFDFAVHAARSESGPLVVIEHLAAGLPLVCTRTGSIARRAEELGVEGFVPPDDPDALAAAMDELVGASAPQRMARAAIGRQIARRYLDIRSVMPAWIAVYEKVARKSFLPAPAAITIEPQLDVPDRLAAPHSC
jgi:glycosyltransferase involved in cell wall biosynthesis